MTAPNPTVSGDARQEKVVIERTYRASVAELWDLWTTKEGFESWWGPEGFRVEVHRMEARPGGALEYDMIADAPGAIEALARMNRPPSHGTRGWFAVFQPHERLTLVHAIDFIPEVETYESTIEVAFHARGPEARMVVTLHPHRDPHWTRMSAEGFSSQLGKLDRRFGWSKDARGQ